jgi:small subunit ribosomal protein S20
VLLDASLVVRDRFQFVALHQPRAIGAGLRDPAAIVADRGMANIASQIKRIQRTERERGENRRLQSSVKTYFTRLERAAGEGDAEAVSREHRELVSRIDKAVQRGALHRNSGARKKARAARIASGVSA